MVSRFIGTQDFEQQAIMSALARKNKASSVESQKPSTQSAGEVGGEFSLSGPPLPVLAAGLPNPIDIIQGKGFVGPLEAIEKFAGIVPFGLGQKDLNIPGLIEGGRAIGQAVVDTADIFQEIGAAFGFQQGPITAARNIVDIVNTSPTRAQGIEEIGIADGGAPVGVPGIGMPVPVGQLSVGAQAPAMGTITKVWDTWPGRGVTGGGRAPIFFRTIDGKTFVRKIDGTIKKVPKSTNLVLNTRKINLNTFIRMDRAIERISARIAKKSKRLKRS